jgi:site-specific recombinase XerD
MSQVNFYYSLDKTFKKGEDIAKIKQMRKAGVKMEKFYQPDPTSIYLGCTVNGTYLKVNTGIKVRPIDWDFNAQKVLRHHTHNLELNALLGDIKSHAEKQYLTLRTNRVDLNPETVKQVLYDSVQRKDRADVKVSFWVAFQEFLAQSKSLIKTSTLNKYGNLQKTLREFEKVQYDLSFEKMTSSFFADFKTFSFSVKGHMNNTVAKNTKCLKAFLRWAEEHHNKYNTKNDYQKWKVESDESEVIYLEQMELEWIEKYPPEAPGLALSKDLFLFQCYTGQRHSDILNLKVGDIRKSQEQGYNFEWAVSQIKGNKKGVIYIPLLPAAEKIFLAYSKEKGPDKTLFPKQCNQILNKNIKKIGKAVGINTSITKVNYSGTKRIDKTAPKYDFLSSHVARKTFVTLSLKNGMRPELVKAITGHTSLKVMQRYIGVNKEMLGSEMLAAWS